MSTKGRRRHRIRRPGHRQRVFLRCRLHARRQCREPVSSTARTPSTAGATSSTTASIGNNGNNMLGGGKGDDILDGGGGADFMMGGDRRRRLRGRQRSATSSGNCPARVTTASVTTVSYTLGPNVENLYLSWLGGAIDGTGNEPQQPDRRQRVQQRPERRRRQGPPRRRRRQGHDYGGEDDDTWSSTARRTWSSNTPTRATTRSSAPRPISCATTSKTWSLGSGDINGYGNDDGNRIWNGSGNNR